MTGLFPWGVNGQGMDQYIRDETELGGRAAVGLDAENSSGVEFLLHDLVPEREREAGS